MKRSLLILALLFAPLAHAQEATPQLPIVHATLVIDAPLVKRNAPIAAGIRFTIPPHWHIYWQNPGDSGIPTTLEWTLPDGLTAGPIAWPLPTRIETQGLVNYGYSDAVTLPVTLLPTRDNVDGTVKVKASWLACKDICIPESAELSASLNADADGAKRIADARTTVPQPFDGHATFTVDTTNVTLTLKRDDPWGAIDTAGFFPVEDGLMANDPAGTFKTIGNELIVTNPRGIADTINDWHGVLHYTQNGKQFAYDITANNSAPVAAAAPAPTPAMPMPVPPSFLIALALAFVGGLILNIMPCVLPILALKALALAKKSGAERRAAIRQGVAYTAGVVISFLLIAGFMLALKATGSAIGWGFQLQNPTFVGVLALIMLLVAANLLGLFELPVLFGELATGIDDTKLRGSFLTGVLAVLVATPCSAPFMATAIGATLSFPPVEALAVFAVLGLGMASPFLLISIWPAARRLLPKPGKWMATFKHILAIPMLATAAWLLFVLVQLVHPMAMETSGGHEMFTPAKLEQLRTDGTPVLLDATAAWCLTCKVNERIALKPDEMQQFFRDHHVTLMVADWTSSDPAITALLASFGRNGVPLYVYYPPHGQPVVLPQVLTPSVVRDAITTQE
jgi:thiol:disulfide interchange protein